jgi:hypothetical protein
MAKDIQKHDPYAAALEQDVVDVPMEERRLPQLQLLQGNSRPCTKGLALPGRWWSEAQSSEIEKGHFAMLKYERVWQVFEEKKLKFRTHDPKRPEVDPDWKHRAIYVLALGPFNMENMIPSPHVVVFQGKGGWSPGNTWVTEVANKRDAMGLAVPLQLYEFNLAQAGDNWDPVIRFVDKVPVEMVADAMTLAGKAKGMVLADDFDIRDFQKPAEKPDVPTGGEELPF